jgi:hypothetical protein
VGTFIPRGHEVFHRISLRKRRAEKYFKQKLRFVEDMITDYLYDELFMKRTFNFDFSSAKCGLYPIGINVKSSQWRTFIIDSLSTGTDLIEILSGLLVI